MPILVGLDVEVFGNGDAPFVREDNHRIQASGVRGGKLIHPLLATNGMIEHRHLEAHPRALAVIRVPKRLDATMFGYPLRNDSVPDDARQLWRGRHIARVDVALAPQELRDPGPDGVEAYTSQRLDVGQDDRRGVSSALEWQGVEQYLQSLPDLGARSWHQWYGGVDLVHWVALK